MSKTIKFSQTPDGIKGAAKVLISGGTVAFPTETVYGLGADATNPEAVAAIYAAKGRPSFNPLIAHVCDIAMAEGLVEVSADAKALMQAFWPGALTLVLPLKPDHGIATAVTAGLSTLAVRMPDHPVASDLLQKVARPVAAPSANPSGRISPTNADHVLDGLDGLIDGLITGGACGVGLESTILSLTPNPTLLRPGGITPDQIEAVLGRQINTGNATPQLLTAPGQLASHYAPTVPVRLNATTATSDETLIGFGSVEAALSLSASGDLAEAAERLFALLRQAEVLGKPIAIAPIPSQGIGLAINDRLTRAAAPKD